MSKELKVIQGAGSGQKSPKIQANNMQSNTRGRVLDLLCYGPIEGVVGGPAGVYLNDTPMVLDGEELFDTSLVQFRNGDEDQEPMVGFDWVGTPVSKDVELDTSGSTFAITPGTDAVHLTFKIPSLVVSDSKGNRYQGSVAYIIDMREEDGGWVTVLSNSVTGKNTAAYEFTVRVEMPPNDGTVNYVVRVRRRDPASTSDYVQDNLYLSYYTEVQDVKLYYPRCALVGVDVNAEQFGTQIPSRKYLTKLRKVRVPDTYDPVTRTYSNSPWLGGFDLKWTDNPVWCFLDLATDPFIGAGLEVDPIELYPIAQYCDELVPDLRGGLEPRFTFNALLQNQGKAIELLMQMASVFRGIVYWASDRISLVADMPSPTDRVITPMDVIDGVFNYVGHSLDNLHSVVVVDWSNPEVGYEVTPEVVEDRESILRFGYKEKKIQAFACTSRSQARRVGKWFLYSERKESDRVTFKMPVHGFDMYPGVVFKLSDPLRSEVRVHGLITEVGASTITIDQIDPNINLDVGQWTVTINSLGGILEYQVASYSGNTLTLVGMSSGVVREQDSFVLSSADVSPRSYRVLSVKEESDYEYTVEAVSYDPQKFDEVEYNDYQYEGPRETYVVPERLASPSSLLVDSYTYLEGDSYLQAIEVSWTPPSSVVDGVAITDTRDGNIEEFELQVKYPGTEQFVTVYRGADTSYTIKSINPIELEVWRFRIASISSIKPKSLWVESSITIENKLKPPVPYDLQFSSTNHTITVRPVFEMGVSAHEIELYRTTEALIDVQSAATNATYIGTNYEITDDGGDTPLTWNTQYYYYARSINQYGVSPFITRAAFTAHSADEILKFIWDEERVSDGTSTALEIYNELKKISGAGPGSVQDRLDELVIDLGLDGLREEVETIQDELAYYGSIPEWEDQGYQKGTMVHHGGTVYTAVQDVPANTPPPDPVYWKDLGTLSQQILEVNNSKVEITNLRIMDEHMALEQGSMSARFREVDYDEDDVLRGSLATYDNRAKLTQQNKVIADAERSLVQRLTDMEVTFKDYAEGRFTQLEQLQADADAAFYRNLTDIDLRFEANSQRLTSLQTLITDNSSAIYRDLKAVQQQVVGLETATEAEMSRLEELVSTESTIRYQDIQQVKGSIAGVGDDLALVSGELTRVTQLLLDTEEAIYRDIGQVSLDFENGITQVSASISSLEEAILTDDTAVYNRIRELAFDRVSDDLGQMSARITNIENFTSYPDSELYSKIESVAIEKATAEGNIIKGLIGDEKQLLLTADSALGTRIDTMQVQVDNNSGYIIQINNLEVKPDSAFGQMLSGLGVAVRGDGKVDHIALVDTVSSVEASVNEAKAEHKLAVVAGAGDNMVVTGIKMTSSVTGTTRTSKFVIQADDFKIIPSTGSNEEDSVSPFEVKAGKVMIKAALIDEAVITSLSVGQTIKSEHFKLNALPTEPSKYVGWVLHKNGNFLIRGGEGGAAGGSILITHNGLIVYDKDNKVRVKLGNLNKLGTENFNQMLPGV